jgi:hypothetical protein
LAKHLRLSLSLWQEPYEGPGYDIPAGTAYLSYILREGKIKHPSSLDTPYLNLPSFPRSLSLGPVVIQTTNHFYICTSITSDLLQDTQDELYVHLENFIDPSFDSSTSEVLPLPEPASAALFRTVHKRSSEARRAAKKARLTPAEKREIWDDRRACDRDVGAAQREYLLSQRLAPHHSITQPLDWAPNARRTSRYDEVFQYYQKHAGGDADLEVLVGIDRPNVTGDPWQRGVFATRDLLPGKRFPYFGALLRKLTKPENYYTLSHRLHRTLLNRFRKLSL